MAVCGAGGMRLHWRKTDRLRRKLYRKQESRCGKCNLMFLIRGMELHHLIPVSKNGPNDESNLEMWCRDCHFEQTRYENTHESVRDGKRDWRVFLRTEEKRVFRRIAT